MSFLRSGTKPLKDCQQGAKLEVVNDHVVLLEWRILNPIRIKVTVDSTQVINAVFVNAPMGEGAGSMAAKARLLNW